MKTPEPEDLDDVKNFRHLLTLPYDEIVPFVFEHLRRKTPVILFFWASCLILLVLAIRIRIDISGYFELRNIFLHTILGAVVLPVAVIPLHEFLHVVPYFLSGARNIKIGMDLKQYLFYVTAHRHVASQSQFMTVAVIPFVIISIILVILMIGLPPLGKWSVSLFLFVHTTMCAGDFALLSFYWINRKKKIFTWDDAEKKEAYFYQEL